jgi:hypothetical protein
VEYILLPIQTPSIVTVTYENLIYTLTKATIIFKGDKVTARLFGLVVRVLGYRSGDPGSIPGTTRKKKQWVWNGGTLSLVSTTEELLDRKVVAPV